jgi:hypothetical protein
MVAWPHHCRPEATLNLMAGSVRQSKTAHLKEASKVGSREKEKKSVCYR